MYRALIVSLLAVLLFVGGAQAKPSNLPLHRGSHGFRVSNAQWLLGGHKPSKFRSRRFRIYKGKPSGYFGKNTAKAVVRMKYRLGYQRKFLKPVFGRTLRSFLLGKRKRPILYLRRSARRARYQRLNSRGWSTKLIQVARREYAKHPRETSYNYGPRVAVYQSSTGAYHAAWCVSFQQWVRLAAGFHTIANRSAGVGYVTEYAHRRGWLRSKPSPGYLAAYGSQHITLVVSVRPTGFYSIGGNESDTVRYRFHARGERPSPVFIRADNKAR